MGFCHSVEEQQRVQAVETQLRELSNLLNRSNFNEKLAAMRDNQRRNLFHECLMVEHKSTKIMTYIGIYYQFIEKNYDEMEKYYLMAIDGGSVTAMNNLGAHYCATNKNYEDAKKYFAAAIAKGDMAAAYNIGLYYYIVEKNYADAKKYFKLAADKGCLNAIRDLGAYYYIIEENNTEAKKYFKLAIDKGNASAMVNLAICYHAEKNYIDAKKYFKLATANGYPCQEEYAEMEKEIFLNLLDNIDKLPTIFVYDADRTNCLICQMDKKLVVNFNCLGQHNHTICIDCAKQWYTTHPAICINCTNPICTDNITINSTQNVIRQKLF